MDAANEWKAIAAEVGLELRELSVLDAMGIASLSMHGLDPGQEDQLPEEEQTKLRRFEKALALFESFSGVKVSQASPTAFLIHGQYRGHSMSAHSIAGREDPQAGISLRFPRRLGLGLRITREGLGHKLGKFLRLTQDLQLDDPELDPLILVQAEDVEGAQAWLADPGLREDLRTLFELSRGIEVLDWGLRYTVEDGKLTADLLRSVLNAMLPVAAHVSS
jgi:hypothetical protein